MHIAYKYLSISVLSILLAGCSGGSTAKTTELSNIDQTSPSTLNHLPQVSNVKIVGIPKVGNILTLNYNYSDIDGDPEGDSIIAWTTPTKELQRGTSKTFEIPGEIVGETISAWVHPSDGKVVTKRGIQASNKFIKVIDENAETALNINNIQVTNINTNSVTIKWATDDYTTGQIKYGIDTNYGEYTTKDEEYISDHSITLTHLETNTLYHYKIISENKDGTSITSIDKTFRTLAVEFTEPVSTGSIGAKAIRSTSLNKGSIFVSTNGKNNSCTNAIPCSLATALSKLKAGDTLFLKGGTYSLSMNGLKRVTISKDGTASNPIIIESYPGEKAIIEGSSLSPYINEERKYGSIQLSGDYIKFRKIEIRNMPEKGIYINANHVTVEGCIIHHNGLSGINASSVTGVSIRNNIVHHNSDYSLGINKWNYDNGDNADGISTSNCQSAIIENNTVYNNSDDGIDCWGSNNTLMRYNKSYSNGMLSDGSKAGKGNGKGIKTGGKNSRNNTASFNLVWNNYSSGIDISESTNYNAKFLNNTAWNNGGKGFVTYDGIGNIIKNNIAFNNKIAQKDYGENINNSWQISGTIHFMSTTPSSEDFLKPVTGSVFEDIGAYAF